MTPELRAYAERAVKDAPPLTEEQVQRLALLLNQPRKDERTD